MATRKALQRRKKRLLKNAAPASPQARIRATIQKIPKGKVSTYGAVARAAGPPRGHESPRVQVRAIRFRARSSKNQRRRYQAPPGRPSKIRKIQGGVMKQFLLGALATFLVLTLGSIAYLIFGFG